MKYIKSFKLFLENGDAVATAAVSGMGAVSNAQPGALPGTAGTEGSGDVSFYLSSKKKRIKKGKPDEISDLRFLEPAKGITKVKEGIVYSDINEYISEIKSKLTNYNIRPLVLSQILDKYEDIINEYYNDGRPAADFVKMIVEDFELDSGGFNSFIGAKPFDPTIKYL
jgi:hypothetical protein